MQKWSEDMKSLSSISVQGTFMNVIKCLNRLLNSRENCYSLLQSDSVLVQYFLVSLSLCVRAQLCLTLCNPMGVQPSRLLCSWDFPGKNTGVGCHFLLQGIFLTQGSNPRFFVSCVGTHHLGISVFWYKFCLFLPKSWLLFSVLKVVIAK